MRTGRAQVAHRSDVPNQEQEGLVTPACTHACTLVYLLYKEPSITHFSTHELPSPISFFFARRITPIWRPKVIKKVTKMVTQTMCMTFPCGEQNHTHGPGWPKVPRQQGQGPPRSPASRDRDHLGRPRGVKMTQKVVQKWCQGWST